MDLTCEAREDGSPTKTTEVIMTVNDESNKTGVVVVAAQEEYDPSQPLDSSDEEEEHGTLQFENDVVEEEDLETVEVPEPEPREIILTPPKSLKSASNLPKEPEIDLNSIPMPSDEYRRPVIQFSIPTRHRLMSISSLIKRQKGVMKKQDKVGGSGLCYNSEISKAFHKSDSYSSGEAQFGGTDSGDEDRPKISLVQEIFGSDDEERDEAVDEETEDVRLNPGGMEEPSHPTAEEIDEVEVDAANLSFQGLTEDPNNKRWKIVEETTIQESPDRSLKDKESMQNCTPRINLVPSPEPEENSVEELRISIKPPSELMEKVNNDDDASSDVDAPETSHKNETNESERGKENEQIILECVSEEDTDFEVTFVGIGRSVTVHRPKQGRQELKSTEKIVAPRKKSLSPLNGFEEGEIIEQADRKKKKAKKKKSKKRKRSKDSRVSSSKLNSERSNADSVEKKSFSENSDRDGNGKEVSWRKPSKLTKTRNYRNGKRESEEKHPGDRPPKKDESGHRKGRSPGRYSGAIDKSRSRRHRSLSSGRFRSRSGSGSRDSSSRWNGRSRGTKRINRAESHKSRSSISNHSSPSHSRSRSLTKKKVKRRHSPSPARKHRNGRSVSRSPIHLSKSPHPNKRNKSNGTETSKRDKMKERSKSPVDAHSSSKKSSKSKHEDPVVDEGKKKGKKEKTSSEDLDKEKKKKRKRREKSLSPVKAIVADGDSIVVSLSFQKSKEEVPRTSKVTASSKNETSSERDKGNSNTTDHSDDERSGGGNSKPSPRKGTIMINLDSSPSQEFRKSPDIIILSDEYEQRVTKSHDSKKGQDQKSEGKGSGVGLSQRNEGLDFVSSSHDCSVDNNTLATFPAVPDSKVAASPAERATSASKSPYKFSEYFVSSTCDVGKTASPSVESGSPKHYAPAKAGEPTETSLSQKVSDNSPFPASETPRPGNSTENGQENSTVPSPEPLHMPHGKGSNGLSSKPMIGNIPGLFPTGFSTGPGGMVTAAPIVIPAPPRIIPSTNSQPNLLNPNVLVSVASALYAPLLAAKQHHNATVSSGQVLNIGMSNISRHGQTGKLFSRNQNSHSQALGLYNNRTNNGGRGGERNSPDSPNSSDGDDLFEPPGDGGPDSGTPTKKTIGSDPSTSATATLSSPAWFGTGDGGGNDKQSMFESLFSTTPKKSAHSKHAKKKNSSHPRRSKQKRGGKRNEIEKNGEGEISARLSEDVPTSAVALKMKEKFLKKLNRQERVVEEVKLSLKPHYSKKHITKDEYKDILRKAVPKICHNKSGEINPNKIKELVEAYVKKFRKTRKTENKIT